MINHDPVEEKIALNSEPFEVRLLNCIVTKELAPCIVVKLAEFETALFDEETGKPLTEEDGKPQKSSFEVLGQFSLKGLRLLIDKLCGAPMALPIAAPDEVRRQSPYMWMVILKSGQRIYQYSDAGEETPFKIVHIPDVQQFWIVPQPDIHMCSLPAYGLLQDQGFVTVAYDGGEIEPLNLPWPADRPFWTQYYRRVLRQFTTISGVPTEHPAYIKQVLGWRIEENGHDVTFEISIESDGHYQVWKKEPLDDPRFEAVGESA